MMIRSILLISKILSNFQWRYYSLDACCLDFLFVRNCISFNWSQSWTDNKEFLREKTSHWFMKRTESKFGAYGFHQPMISPCYQIYMWYLITWLYPRFLLENSLTKNPATKKNFHDIFSRRALMLKCSSKMAFAFCTWLTNFAIFTCLCSKVQPMLKSNQNYYIRFP